VIGGLFIFWKLNLYERLLFFYLKES